MNKSFNLTVTVRWQVDREMYFIQIKFQINVNVISVIKHLWERLHHYIFTTDGQADFTRGEMEHHILVVILTNPVLLMPPTPVEPFDVSELNKEKALLVWDSAE